MTRKKVVKEEPIVETKEDPEVVETKESVAFKQVDVKGDTVATFSAEEVVQTKPEPVTDVRSLDEHLLSYIKQLKEPFNIHKAVVTLEEPATLIHQAWDRLFDKGLVPYLNIK